MKSRTLICLIGIAFFAITIPAQLAGQQNRYKFIDIPTLGGPAAYGNVDSPEYAQFINNPGVIVGGSDTALHDPNAPNCINQDCFLTHGFRWQDGVLTDLGTLPGGDFSHAASVNARGWAAGGSNTAVIDPLIGALAEHAVLWKDNEPIDLGTLGSGLESAALYVNNAAEVVGFSTYDTTPANSFVGAHTHAFIWDKGAMRDLETLGGPDSSPSGGCDNQRSGLVAGQSNINSTPNNTTGVPTQHAFLWQNGAMSDIPTLGGTFAFAQCANNRAQVIGQSNLTGDSGCDGSAFDGSCFQRAFLWDHGMLTDLGALGGTFSSAFWLNNAGEVVGGATTTGDEEFHATLWKSGRITDLNKDGDCFSIANSINSSHQIIGNTFNCDTGYFTTVVWEENGSVTDLNAAIPANSSLFLVEADNINDRGEIVGRGLPPGCDNLDLCGHVFLLVPCAAGQGCEGNDNVSRHAESPSITMTATQRREMSKAQSAYRKCLGSSPRSTDAFPPEAFPIKPSDKSGT
jgi:probable HAF family extracellular repeat protein